VTVLEVISYRQLPSVFQSQVVEAWNMVAGGGIGHIPPSTRHSKSIAYIITAVLKIKAFLRCVNRNFCRLFLTPFYSQPMRFAGASAGTLGRKFMQSMVQIAVYSWFSAASRLLLELLMNS